MVRWSCRLMLDPMRRKEGSRSRSWTEESEFHPKSTLRCKHHQLWRTKTTCTSTVLLLENGALQRLVEENSRCYREHCQHGVQELGHRQHGWRGLHGGKLSNGGVLLAQSTTRTRSPQPPRATELKIKRERTSQAVRSMAWSWALWELQSHRARASRNCLHTFAPSLQDSCPSRIHSRRS